MSTDLSYGGRAGGKSQHLDDERKEHHKQKTLALAESIFNTAAAICKQIKTAFPKKRAFRPIDRTPGKRIRKQAAKATIPLTGMMGATQISLILSQPLPKFQMGAFGMDFNDNGKSEVVVTEFIEGGLFLPPLASSSEGILSYKPIKKDSDGNPGNNEL